MCLVQNQLQEVSLPSNEFVWLACQGLTLTPFGVEVISQGVVRNMNRPKDLRLKFFARTARPHKYVVGNDNHVSGTL